jgi:hypothetical protein
MNIAKKVSKHLIARTKAPEQFIAYSQELAWKMGEVEEEPAWTMVVVEEVQAWTMAVLEGEVEPAWKTGMAGEEQGEWREEEEEEEEEEPGEMRSVVVEERHKTLPHRV